VREIRTAHLTGDLILLVYLQFIYIRHFVFDYIPCASVLLLYSKQRPLLGNAATAPRATTELLEAVFSVLSVPRLYKEQQLRFGTAVRGVDVIVKQSPASRNVSREAEETMALEAVTRREPVKVQQSEKTSARCGELQGT
jgi:hypothetical protein